MSISKKKITKKADEHLDQALEDTFPASDPPSVLRSSSDKSDKKAMEAAPINRRPPAVSGSSEAQVKRH